MGPQVKTLPAQTTSILIIEAYPFREVNTALQ